MAGDMIDPQQVPTPESNPQTGMMMKMKQMSEMMASGMTTMTPEQMTAVMSKMDETMQMMSPQGGQNWMGKSPPIA